MKRREVLSAPSSLPHAPHRRQSLRSRTTRVYAAVPLRPHHLPHLPPFWRGCDAESRLCAWGPHPLSRLYHPWAELLRAQEIEIGHVVVAFVVFGAPFTTSPASPPRSAGSSGDGGVKCRSVVSWRPDPTATRSGSSYHLHRRS